jgi:hypothetical protein
MRHDAPRADGPVGLASGAVGNRGAGAAGGTVALARPSVLGGRLALPRARIALGPLAGRLALASLIIGALAVVVFATAGPSILVPRSWISFPSWEAGPLHGLFGRLPNDPDALSIGFSCVVLAMLVAYGVVLASVRTISMRAIVLSILALHAILLLSPPLQLTDLFNYLGYARLGAVHHLNPYRHVIAQEMHDPVYRFSTWHHLRSPYGPLFTAASYPLSLLPMPVAYWTLKVSTELLSLGFIALVWRCARQLGRDPRFAVVFVALNPVYLMYGVAGFHNDFLMLVAATGAISLLLAGRDRAAGATLMLAVAVKFTAVLLLPFLLIAARPARRRWQVMVGALLGAIPLTAMSLALFGFSIPNLQDQSTLLTDLSIPNVVGWAIGAGGGAPWLLRVGNVLLVLAVVYVLRRRREWLTEAGWATVALVASLAWLVPWYVIWVLPLAALGSSIRLRRAAVALTAYLVIAFIPTTGMILTDRGVNPMGGPVGQASEALQHRLAQ